METRFPCCLSRSVQLFSNSGLCNVARMEARENLIMRGDMQTMRSIYVLISESSCGGSSNASYSQERTRIKKALLCIFFRLPLQPPSTNPAQTLPKHHPTSYDVRKCLLSSRTGPRISREMWALQLGKQSTAAIFVPKVHSTPKRI